MIAGGDLKRGKFAGHRTGPLGAVELNTYRSSGFKSGVGRCCLFGSKPTVSINSYLLARSKYTQDLTDICHGGNQARRTEFQNMAHLYGLRIPPQIITLVMVETGEGKGRTCRNTKVPRTFRWKLCYFRLFVVVLDAFSDEQISPGHSLPVLSITRDSSTEPEPRCGVGVATKRI